MRQTLSEWMVAAGRGKIDCTLQGRMCRSQAKIDRRISAFAVLGLVPAVGGGRHAKSIYYALLVLTN
jgi:hypothetical protein